jgi:hypothetical protein
MVIVNYNLTMITGYNEMVNLNFVTIGVSLVLKEQVLCNWPMVLMHTIMPHVRLIKGPLHLKLTTRLQLIVN